MRQPDVTPRGSGIQRVAMAVRGGTALASLPLRMVAEVVLRRGGGYGRAVENASEALRELERPAPELDGLEPAAIDELNADTA